MLNKSLIAVALLAGIVLLLWYPKVYVIRGSAGGMLYWNADEALLFIGGGSSGARMSYPRYALEPFLLAWGNVRQPDNDRCTQIEVIRVTASEVQHFETDLWRHATDPDCGYRPQIFDGQLYAVSWPQLWKWSGTKFEWPTPQEYGAYATAFSAGKFVSQHPWEFDNVEGWSMRQLGSTPPKYDLVLGGQRVTLLFHGETWPPKPLSVDLTRPGQAPQTIWSFDGRPHRVSRAEYEHVFGQR